MSFSSATVRCPHDHLCSGSRMLLLSRNLLIQASTRTSLLYKEKLVTISSVVSTTVARHRISGNPVCPLFQQVTLGYDEESWASHSGPFHHSCDCVNSCGFMPLNAMSAGSDVVGTCLHFSVGTFLVIFATRLLTNELQVPGGARDPAESDGRIRPGIDTVWWNVEGFSNDYKETAEE